MSGHEVRENDLLLHYTFDNDEGACEYQNLVHDVAIFCLGISFV